MDAAALDYVLPDAAVAQVPAEPRDAARLLDALDPAAPVDRHVRDLPALLSPGDLVVLNRTRVRHARLRLERPGGGRAEVLLLEPTGAGWWSALVRPARRLPAGTVLTRSGTPLVEMGGRRGDVWAVRLLVEEDRLPEVGEVPLPPYLTRPLADPDRYQTVFASGPPVSAAAPTAGLHLTPTVLEGIAAAGAAVAYVDLEVGLGTFRPVTAERVEDHPVHAERYEVPPETLEACAAAARVVAVGTTVVRALESAAAGPVSGRTSLLIVPGHRFRAVDVLVTNFHLPRSTLLALVEAFCGPRWRDLYRHALAAGYRFLSFGDAMVVGRAR